jgi:hypothetical protein
MTHAAWHRLPAGSNKVFKAPPKLGRGIGWAQYFRLGRRQIGSAGSILEGLADIQAY